MKIKLGELKEMVTGLYAIQEKRFPVKISYAIAKNVKKLAEEHADYEKQRIKLCEEFANKDNDGNPVSVDGKYDIPNDSLKEFNDSVNELRDTEIDVDIHSVSFSELDKCDTNERYDIPTVSDVSSMEFMLKED